MRGTTESYMIRERSHCPCSQQETCGTHISFHEEADLKKALCLFAGQKALSNWPECTGKKLMQPLGRTKQEQKGTKKQGRRKGRTQSRENQTDTRFHQARWWSTTSYERGAEPFGQKRTRADHLPHQDGFGIFAADGPLRRCANTSIPQIEINSASRSSLH